MNRIRWERFQDPLERAYRRQERLLENHFYEDQGPAPNVGPAIMTPQGLMPINEANLPNRVFNFWIAHTNFDVTRTLAETVEQIPGVEVLDVLTRYRFRVGVARSFDQRMVKKRIEQALRKRPVGVSVRLKGKSLLRALKKRLLGQYPFCAVVRLGGKLDVVVGKDECEVANKTPPGAERIFTLRGTSSSASA